MNIKVDRAVRDRAKKLARELGLPLSTVVNAQLRQFVRERALRLEAAPRMSAQLEVMLREVEADRQTGLNFSPVFTASGEMDQWLKL